MPTDRYLAHLVQLAQQHAPHLLKTTPDAANHATLANGLARMGYVVVCVQFQGNITELAQEWVKSYARAHHVLAQALFTPFMGFKAAYMDSQSPTLMLLEMESGLLAHSLARTFIPYLALLSHGYNSSMAELDGLLNVLLVDLLASELDTVQRTELQQQLHEILVYLVRMRQTCYSLHTFRREDLVAASAAAINTQPPSTSPAPPAAPQAPTVTPAPPVSQPPKTGPLRSWDSSSWPPPPPAPSSSDSKIFMPVPDPPRKRKSD